MNRILWEALRERALKHIQAQEKNAQQNFKNIFYWLQRKLFPGRCSNSKTEWNIMPSPEDCSI